MKKIIKNCTGCIYEDRPKNSTGEYCYRCARNSIDNSRDLCDHKCSDLFFYYHCVYEYNGKCIRIDWYTSSDSLNNDIRPNNKIYKEKKNND